MNDRLSEASETQEKQMAELVPRGIQGSPLRNRQAETDGSGLGSCSVRIGHGNVARRMAKRSRPLK
jgi:hypothetical protein